MSDELDRKLLPEFIQTAIDISFGASYKGLEMMKSPQESVSKMFSEMKSLITVPDDAGEGLEEKAKSLVAVWMEKGATCMEECRTAGQKFTKDDKPEK